MRALFGSTHYSERRAVSGRGAAGGLQERSGSRQLKNAKALLRAVSIAFDDFSQSVSSPGKLLVVLLFAVCSVFLPLTSWIKACVPQYEEEENAPHVVVLADDTRSRPRIGFKNRVVGALKMRRGRKVTTQQPHDLFDVECETNGDSFVDVDLLAGHAKWE